MAVLRKVSSFLQDGINEDVRKMEGLAEQLGVPLPSNVRGEWVGGDFIVEGWNAPKLTRLKMWWKERGTTR